MEIKMKQLADKTAGRRKTNRKATNLLNPKEKFDLDYILPDFFNFSDSPSVNKLYMAHFGSIPNTSELEFREKLLLECVSEKDLLKLFPDMVFFRKYSSLYMENSQIQIREFDGDDFFGEENSTVLVLFTKELGVEISKRKIKICYNRPHPMEIFSCLQNVYESLPKMCEASPNSVGLITADQGCGFRTIESELETVDLDIETHYNDDFKPVYEDIVRFLDMRGSGIVILHGERGSGKTNFIRYLCQEHPKHYIIVPNGIAPKLGMPDFLDYMKRNKDSVFILEDCEQLLMDREDNSFNEAISTILNMSDGLLSDVFNAKFICTFNADIEKIDKALLRKGRCFAKYRFGKLSTEKTGALMKSLGHKVKSPEPMTLAEIYNYSTRSYGNARKKKIGF